FALSPDGRRIVHTVRPAAGPQLLAIREFSQTKTNLLRGTEGAVDPFFSPDGESIAFFAGPQLRKIAIQGGAPAVLLEGTSNPRGATWSEDGTIVAASVPNAGLTLVPSSGGAPRTLTNPAAKGQATHRWPQFLPGGRTLIFTANSATNGFDDAEIDALDLQSGQWKTVQKGGYFGRYLPSGHLL